MGSSGSTHWVGSRRSGCSFQQQQQQQQETSRCEDCRAIEFQIGHWPKFTNWNHNGCSGLRWQETQRSSPNTLKSNRLVTFQRGKQLVFFLFSPIINTTAISLSCSQSFMHLMQFLHWRFNIPRSCIWLNMQFLHLRFDTLHLVTFQRALQSRILSLLIQPGSSTLVNNRAYIYFPYP